MLRIGGQLHVLRPRCLGSLVVTGRRHFSEDKAAEITAWMRNIKDFRKSEEDRIDLNRVHQLFVTLPSRDGSTGDPVVKPKMGDTLPLGHHLILFPPMVPGHQLHEDGTDSTYDAPPSLTRRMWAGGRFDFNPKNPLKIGQDVQCTTTISNVEKKGSGLVFVEQLEQISNSLGVAVTESRSHVFLPPRTESSRPVRKVVQFFGLWLSMR
jgi:hydroxyacyl-ACP dehydratase HTD2-like protein with hotdog domain